MRPILAAAGLAVLAACSRDLELPAREAAPRLDAVEPAAAYAGELVRLRGAGFAPDPAANLVQFAGAAARAEALEPGALLVRVPPAAGSGPLTVSTGAGTSAPAGAFVYRGLGELAARALTGELPLLHKPYRVAATAGETFVHSDLLVALVQYGKPGFAAPDATSIEALPGSGRLAWLESDYAAGRSRLVLHDAAAGAELARADLADFAGLGPIAVLRGAPDRIAVLRATAGGVTVALHRTDALATEELAPSPLGAAEVRGCTDAGADPSTGGLELACLARRVAGEPLRLAVVGVGASGVSAPRWLDPPGAVFDDPVALEAPLCAAAAGPLGHRAVAVALDDGRLAVADLDAAPAAFGAPVPTGSRTPARGLACTPPVAAGEAGRVLAAKRADDLVTAIELGPSPAIRWSAPVPRASRLAVDGDTVHAAGEGDNVVVLLDLATGALRARRGLDVAPGRAGAREAATWIGADAGEPPYVVFATAQPPGVLEVPTDTSGGAFPLWWSYPDVVGVVPSVSGGWLDLLRAGLAGHPLPAAAQLAADARTYYYAGLDTGLAALEGDGTVHLSTIDAAVFHAVARRADEGVLAAVGEGTPAAWSVRAWTEDEAAAGAPAGLRWDAPAAVVAAELLDGTLWAFTEDGEATELDAALAPGRTVSLADPPLPIIAVSPNGRTFVSFEPQPFSTDTSVVLRSADATAGFPRLATVAVQGTATGAAFDGTGERLYVLTREPDRLVLLE